MIASTTGFQPSTSALAVSGKPGFKETMDRQQGILKEMRTLDVPFNTKLSLAPLLNFWAAKLDSADLPDRLVAGEVMKLAADVPELWEPVEDLGLLDRHRDLVELLLLGLFPPGLRDVQLAKASKPFDIYSFYMTPGLQRMMLGCQVRVKMEDSGEAFYNSLAIRACAMILNRFYGQNIEEDPHVIFTVQPGDGGLQHHFKLELNVQFCEVVPVRPLKKLTQAEINHLLSNVYDLEAWLEALPPDHFELHGLLLTNLVDITKEETLSRLRFTLMEKDAIVKPGNVAQIELLLKSFFQMPGLRLGIMAIDDPSDRNNEFKYKIRHCFLAEQHDCLLHPSNAGSVYDKALRYREMLLVEDLEKLSAKTSIEKGFLEQGLRSYLVAPLLSKDGKIIGLIELGSPDPYEITSFVEQEFRKIVPLFNLAVERSREETDNKIEAIIREQFTAIHPSVEWRFVEAAFNYLDRQETQGKQAMVEPISFEDVYPLYAQADIVNSSNTRNEAIQEDLIKNLQLIRDALSVAAQRVDFPLLDHYLLETEHRIEELQKDLKSNDESLLLDFIVREVHPLLEEAARQDASLAQVLNIYRSQLDPHLGIVYHKRKDYEQSVNRINSAISDYLEREDERTQRMIPHYFEKYKTDGVQFELYAGQSLLRNGQFNDLHLRNLRLWQLIAVCEITRNMEKLKNELPLPLSTAQLVFVYGQPISICFREDDKRFDVDGAYNIRYEIIKKRIDKATVTTPDGKIERLTQAGKIAIVYASEKDREEYLHYLAYLRRQEFIEDAIEEVELEKLQGVQGLKALRVTAK